MEKGEKVTREGGEAGFPAFSPTGIDLTSAQREFERVCIEKALAMAEGRETKAAKLLNLNYYTFRYRRKKLKI